MFYEQGWVLTSVAEICRVADVSRVTFYKYFPTKQALVKRIFEEQKNKIREGFDVLLDTQSDLSKIITKNFINAARFYGNIIFNTSLT